MRSGTPRQAAEAGVRAAVRALATGRMAELQLPLMVDQNTESHGTAFTISVDHRSVGSGISAANRAATVTT